MATLTLKYRDGSSVYSRSFTILAHRGLDDPDAGEFVPGLQWEGADGTLVESIVGFRRLATVTFGMANDATDRAFILRWLMFPRWIVMSPYADAVFALADPERFENDWRDGSQYQRFYEVTLRETSIHSAWPDAAEPNETETLYITDWIEITGTEASPQTLTTNSGALATDAAGNAFPAINLSAYTVTVLITERQDSLICQIGDVTQAGSDISFTVARSGAGNPYSDGKFYARITLGLQAIP